MRSRQARRRAEQIYTERAKANFPPVSSVILHRDGSIEERASPRRRIGLIQSEDLCGTYYARAITLPNEQEQTDQVGSHRKQPSIPERLLAWLRLMFSKLPS